MKLTSIKTLVAALLLSSAFSASATLIGDTVGTTYISSTGANSGTVNSVVGAGEEGNFFSNQYFDYDAFSFDIRSTSTYGGIYSANSADTITLSLTSLDFSTGSLTGVLLDTNLTGVSFIFGSDFVDFTWNEQTINTGTYLSAIFSTSSVPEPSIALLLGIGLVGMVGMSRKRKLS